MVSTILLMVGCILLFQGIMNMIFSLVQCALTRQSTTVGPSNVACLIGIVMIVLSFKI
jgi:hypothetical protein